MANVLNTKPRPEDEALAAAVAALDRADQNDRWKSIALKKWPTCGHFIGIGVGTHYCDDFATAENWETGHRCDIHNDGGEELQDVDLIRGLKIK